MVDCNASHKIYQLTTTSLFEQLPIAQATLEGLELIWADSTLMDMPKVLVGLIEIDAVKVVF